MAARHSLTHAFHRQNAGTLLEELGLGCHQRRTPMTSSLTFELNDEQRVLRDTIREFAESEIAPHAGEWDQNHTFPVEVVRKLGELGAMGVAFPEEYGGLGAGAVAQAVVV